MLLDLHNHMLPGIDDGSLNWDQSLAMARIAVEDGIEGVVCTPHWIEGRYDNTRPLILSAVKTLRRKLKEHAIPLKVYPGAELRIEADLDERIFGGELLTLNDTGRFALIELPSDVLPQNLEEFFGRLRAVKIIPIISHPERNPALLKDPMRLYDWIQMGILAQLTAASLVGHFGTTTRKFSASLLEYNLVHIIATDAHGPNVRTPRLSEGFKVIKDMKGETPAFEMAYEIPKRIISGRPVVPEEPLPLHKPFPAKRFFFSLFKSLIMLVFLSSCNGGQAVREISQPSAPSPSSLSQTGMSKHATNDDKAVQEIATGEKEERVIQVERKELSRTEYIREKFKAKTLVFPKELKRARPERSIYQIGPEDELYVNVWQNPDLSTEAIVRDDGRISLPLVGEVHAAGLEVSDLERLLRRKYARYVENPQVTITVRAVNSLRVFITGAVRVPTVAAGPLPAGFPLRGDKRLLTALSQVELLPDADLSEAYIVRSETIIPLDLNRLLKDGDMTQNILLKPADTIVIPGEIKEIVVLGEVNRPGSYKVKRRTTLLDAIAAGGGIKYETAVLSMSYVARRGKALPVNFKRLIDGGDLDQNILIEDNDVIYIPSSQDNKIFVMGEVGRPGVVRFTEPMDVVEAITRAGDFETTANRSQVVVVRGAPHHPKVYAINALKMMEGATAERFFLDQRDILYVPRTAIANWNVFINNILPTLTAINIGSESIENLD